MRAEPATVGYHLVIARCQDPELEATHLAAAGTKLSPSPASLTRMEEIRDRRLQAADGTLSPAYRDGLASIPGWEGNPRAAAGDARWHARLAQLAEFRAEGNDWPRHHHYASDREHALGVWIHAQRQKHRRRELEPANIKLLD